MFNYISAVTKNYECLPISYVAALCKNIKNNFVFTALHIRANTYFRFANQQVQFNTLQ